MATIDFVEYEDANPEVRQVYDDIMATRKIDWINNFWKALAVQPELLRRTWNGVKEVMAPGNIDMLTKEMIYIAVSVSNGCQYCINSHTAAARKNGMTEEMLSELMAVVGMANQTNALANGFQIDVDEAFQKGGRAFN
jgi:AhpD family alkylhydroperoxidase